MERYQDAAYALDKAAEFAPQNSRIYFFRGKANQHLGRFREAVADFDRALAAEPENADAAYTGGSLYPPEQYDEALGAFDGSLRPGATIPGRRISGALFYPGLAGRKRRSGPLNKHSPSIPGALRLPTRSVLPLQASGVLVIPLLRITVR